MHIIFHHLGKIRAYFFRFQIMLLQVICRQQLRNFALFAPGANRKKRSVPDDGEADGMEERRHNQIHGID